MNFGKILVYVILSSIGLTAFNSIYTIGTDPSAGWMKRMRVSEDLYGRAFFFFLTSIVSYRY